MSKKGNLKIFKLRHIIAIFIIIIIVIILDVILTKYTNNKIDEINKALSKISKMIENEEEKSGELEKLSKDTIEKWEKYGKILEWYAEHDDVEIITSKLYLIDSQIKIKDFEEAVQTISETKIFVRFLDEKQSLSLGNIF